MNQKNYSRSAIALISLLAVSAGAFAAGADLGQAQKQATNWTAIGMFGGLCGVHAVHHQMGCCQDQVGG
jgi:di/tricarboxylate transporter